jgi:hypothetical protein
LQPYEDQHDSDKPNAGPLDPPFTVIVMAIAIMIIIMFIFAMMVLSLMTRVGRGLLARLAQYSDFEYSNRRDSHPP